LDNPTTLIVAIMYVTILSIGLGNLLMALSELVGGRKALPERVHLSWLLFMLLAFCNYFWQATLILEFDNWQFLPFIGFLLGPICLLFAINLLIDLPDGDAQANRNAFLQNSNRFFLLLGLFNVWIVGLDYVTAELSAITSIPVAMALLCFGLMVTKSMPVHKAGAAAAWLILLAGLGSYAF